MRIADLFETKVEEKIEPVIKVGETGDEHKLAGEIGSYVVTPMIEQYVDDMLERTLSQEAATPLLDAAGGIALHFAHWPAADRVLAETSGGSATVPEYGWQRAIVSPRPASDGRLRFSLLLQEASGT